MQSKMYSAYYFVTSQEKSRLKNHCAILNGTPTFKKRTLDIYDDEPYLIVVPRTHLTKPTFQGGTLLGCINENIDGIVNRVALDVPANTKLKIVHHS